MRRDPTDDARRLGRLWDALQAGARPPDADGAFLGAIHSLEEATRVPPPAPDLAQRTWEQITGGPLPLVPVVAAAPSPNGLHATLAIGAMTGPVERRWIARAAPIFRAIAIGAMAGFTAGFVTGLWMRIAMRVSGFLTVDANRGLLTENDARVGQITFGGTLFIAMFGAMVGVLGGLLYVLLRRRLPGNAWQRPLGFGLLLLAVLGFFVMDQNNPDYRLFGPPWLNIGMCSVAYIVFGVLASVLVELLDRRVPPLVTPGCSRRRTALTISMLAPFAVIGTLAIAGVVLQPVAALIAAGPSGGLVLIAGGLAFLLYKRVRRIRTFPVVVALARRPALIGYAAFAVPSLGGLVLTVRAIAAIVGG